MELVPKAFLFAFSHLLMLQIHEGEGDRILCLCSSYILNLDKWNEGSESGWNDTLNFPPLPRVPVPIVKINKQNRRARKTMCTNFQGLREPNPSLSR